MGTLLIANPLHILKSIAGSLPGVIKGSKFTKAWYLDSLKMMYELFGRARRDGLVALESDTDDPEKSTVFSKYPAFLKDHHLLCFVCDTMRLVASNAVEAFELDQMVELDMDVHHHESTAARERRSAPWRTHFPASASWPQCWAWSSPWALWAGPPEEIGRQGCRGVGGHVSGHSALLRIGGAARRQHGQNRG